MICSDLQSCIEAALSDGFTATLYRFNLVYLIVAAALILFIIYLWRRFMEMNPAQDVLGRQVGNLVGLAFAIGLLLTLPAALARLMPVVPYRIVGVPAGASVYQLGTGALQATGELVSGFIWFAIGGLVLQILAMVPLQRLTSRRRLGVIGSDMPTPPSVSRKVPVEELSPRRPTQTATAQARSVGTPSRPPSFSPPIARSLGGVQQTKGVSQPAEADQTMPRPPMPTGTAAGALVGFAWLDFTYAGLRRYEPLPGWPSEWARTRLIDRTLVIGRLPADILQVDRRSFVPLPDAPNWVSRTHVTIEPTPSGYRLRNLAQPDEGSVTVNQQPVAPGPDGILLQNGWPIVIGEGQQSYTLEFWQLGTPALQPFDSVEVWPLRVPGPLGGATGSLGSLYPRSMAEITFEVTMNPPGCYIQAKDPDPNLSVQVDDAFVGPAPLLLRPGAILQIGTMQYKFLLVGSARPIGGVYAH